MNQRDRIELMQLYETGSTFLDKALREFPISMWKYKPDLNKWSIHEIVIHLADSEIQSYVRCRMILAEPRAAIPNHDEHQWSVSLNYGNSDISDIIEGIAVIRLVRTLNSKLLRSVPESMWLNSCIHSVRGKMTLEDWLSDYTAHIPHHIEQMKRTYHAWTLGNPK